MQRKRNRAALARAAVEANRKLRQRERECVDLMRDVHSWGVAEVRRLAEIRQLAAMFQPAASYVADGGSAAAGPAGAGDGAGIGANTGKLET